MFSFENSVALGIRKWTKGTCEVDWQAEYGLKGFKSPIKQTNANI